MRLLLPPLLQFLKDSNREIYEEIIAIKADHVSIELVVEMLQTDAVRQKIAEFKATSNRDPSLVFWMSYLDMISTLLMFTRAERDGVWDLTEEKIKLAEAFICKLYNQVTDTSDEARDLMFGKSKSSESLPPTSDALKLHIERAHFQASVWKQANVVKPVLPSPVTMGWSLDGIA